MPAKRPARKPKQRKQDFTVKDVREIADWLSRIAREADGFAKSLEDSKYKGVLNVDAGETMRQGLEFVVKWLGKCQEAYNLSTIPGQFNGNHGAAEDAKT